MHRHGYKGRKFHRERDQRKALIQGLADSLVKYESIETTYHKAKEIVPYVEKLITKAKKGDLHSRRQIIASLQTLESAHKLVDEIAPKLKGRNSGHLSVVKTRRVSFVDDLKSAPVAKAVEAPAAKKVVKAKPAAKPKTAAKPKAKAKPAKETK